MLALKGAATDVPEEEGNDVSIIELDCLQEFAKNDHSLRLALDEVAGRVGAAVAVDGPLGVELLEALLVGGDAAVTPDLLALQVQGRADPVEAVAGVVRARVAVLLVDVRGTLAGVAGADFRQVALVGRLAADDAAASELRSFDVIALRETLRERERGSPCNRCNKGRSRTRPPSSACR